MATAPTVTEQELIDALELFLEVDAVQEAKPTSHNHPNLYTARLVAEIALAHARREPHCCWGMCDLDECEREGR